MSTWSGHERGGLTWIILAVHSSHILHLRRGPRIGLRQRTHICLTIEIPLGEIGLLPHSLPYPLLLTAVLEEDEAVESLRGNSLCIVSMSLPKSILREIISAEWAQSIGFDPLSTSVATSFRSTATVLSEPIFGPDISASSWLLFVMWCVMSCQCVL